MSALYFDARIDGVQLQRDITNINTQLSRMSDNFGKEGQKIDDITRRMGQGLATYFSVFQATRLVKDIASVRGEYQQLDVAFTTMLGSKVKADKLMSEVVDFAARTPFQLQDVAKGTKQLLAYGVAADDILPTLKSMGDVSAGLSVPIERLILNYGQVRTQLKLTGRELRDFNVAGVPLVAELAKNLGVADDKIAGMVERSQIGFDDVKEAFRTMTDEGGRFNNLMDKQAKTITGLASNFADAWDKMLNSIGQQNEGVIAGTIKGATELVNNYEDVLNILKVLIATYGSYKAAVIAVSVVEKSAVAAGNIKAWFELARGIKTAKDAQIAFNLATKANPYALILAAVASLVTVLTVYGKKTDEAAKISADFTRNLNEETKAVKKRFDAVKNTKDGTEEHKKALDDVNTTYKEYLPNLLTEASNLYEVEKAQNAVTEAIAKNLAFKAQEDQLSSVKEGYEKQLTDFYTSIDDVSKKLNNAQKGQFKALIEQYKDSVKQQYQETGLFVDTFSIDINKMFKDLSGEGLGAFSGTSSLIQSIKDVITSELDLEEQTDSLKTTYEEYLKALGIGGGQDPDPKVLTTIAEKIDQTKKLLDEAKGKLKELRADTSTASVTDIEDQEKKIKEYETQLSILTGVSRKAQKEIDKANKERQQALEEYADNELELERQLQASKVAIMRDGVERQTKEAELAYQQEIDRINKQQQEYLKAWNATKGFEPGDEGYVLELPETELKKFDELRVNAEAKKNERIEKINEETAEKVKSIWERSTESFISDIEAEIRSINNLYDGLVKEAEAAGKVDLIPGINKQRQQAIDEANIQSGLKRLEFEEDIELQRAEISSKGLNREVELEKKKLEIAKKFAQLKIDLLKKSGKEENKQEIKNLEEFIKIADKGIDDLNKKGLKKSVDLVTEFIDQWGELASIISGSDSDLARIVGSLTGVGQGIAKIVSGDYTGLLSIITSIAKLQKDSVSEMKQLQEQQINALKESLSNADKIFENLQQNINRMFGLEKLSAYGKAVNSLGADLVWLINRLNQLANVDLVLPVRDINISYGYNTGRGGRGGYNAFSVEAIETAIEENRINYENLIDQYAASGNEEIKILIEQYGEYIDKLYELKDAYYELVTGTTADSIADAIVQGFRNGLGSAEDFADSFEELMRDAIFSAIKSQLLNGPIQEFYEELYKAAEDGYTEEEIEYLRGVWNGIISFGQTLVDGAIQISGDALSWEKLTDSQQGITGAIKGITEETAGLIAGQFFAMRELQQKTYFTGVEQLDAINQSVTYLQKIEENTKHNKKLVDIDSKLQEMNDYLKQAV